MKNFSLHFVFLKKFFDNVLNSFGILFQILTPTREKAFNISKILKSCDLDNQGL